MLWSSLRASCGSLGPFVGLSVLILIAAVPLGRAPSPAQASVPSLLQPYSAAVPTVSCELSAGTPARFTI